MLTMEINENGGTIWTAYKKKSTHTLVNNQKTNNNNFQKAKRIEFKTIKRWKTVERQSEIGK